MKNSVLLFLLTLFYTTISAQTLVTPTQVNSFQSGTSNAFSNEIYKETTNNLFYIGLQSGRLKLLQDSIKTNATLTGSGFNGNVLGIAQQGATTNQVLKWNGTIWAPANEATIPIDSTTSNNGLTLIAKNIELGGNLVRATSIATSATNTLAFTGLQTGSITDSILVTSSGGVIKKIIAPASILGLPQILVHARRILAYVFPATGFSTLIYNTTNTNIFSAYNTTTGIFTAPATGVYEIIINNGFSLQGRSSIVNQILLNGNVDMQYDLANTGNGAASIVVSTVNAKTLLNMTAGQTASIAIGGLQGTLLPLPAPAFGTGQHVLKIIRLQ